MGRANIALHISKAAKLYTLTGSVFFANYIHISYVHPEKNLFLIGGWIRHL